MSQMMLNKRSTMSTASLRRESVAINRVPSATRFNGVSSNATARASPFGQSISSRKIASTTSPVVVASSASSSSSPQESKQYYALVANAEFYFNDVQNESLAEQLRERVRFFKETGREIDFWLVPEPKWLDSKYPNEAKKVGRPCVALVSSDPLWITFMKLRLDRVLRIDLGAIAQEEALAAGGKVPEFKKPAKWTAPYTPYTQGWWNVFLPSGAPQ